MTDPTSQCPAPPSPFHDDADATPAQLLARAAKEYADARPAEPSHEDRVHGNETGRAS